MAVIRLDWMLKIEDGFFKGAVVDGREYALELPCETVRVTVSTVSQGREHKVFHGDIETAGF